MAVKSDSACVLARSSSAALARATTLFIATLALCSVATGAAASETGTVSKPTLFDLSIEELVSLEVTSVSRKAERLDEATSAVFVISQDDIRRTGARSLPEALRLAPGLTVLQIDASKWAIGSRGFVGRFANKLLVMIDGRGVYTPSFSGVFWDVQDTNLDDVERIEIIRGPGATIWGTNAVNGVINVITRRAGVDPGRRLNARLEADGAYSASLRFADSTAAGWDWRVFLKHHSTPAGEAQSGLRISDDWRVSRAGLRLDGAVGESGTVSLMAEAYTGEAGLAAALSLPQPPYIALRSDRADLGGAFATLRWAIDPGDGARTELQLTLDGTHRDAMQYLEDRRTIGLDLQREQALGRHGLIYGAAYRRSTYELRGSETITVTDSRPSDYVASAFVQSDLVLLPDRLRLTLGSKFEHNSLSNRDLEFLPSARLLWRATDSTNLWGAVTRAVRTPSQAERIVRVLDVAPPSPPGAAENPFPVPLRYAVRGNPAFGPERVVSWEAGVRSRVGDSAAWNLSLFDMEYRGLRTPAGNDAFCSPSGVAVGANPLCLFGASGVIIETTMTNSGRGSIRGGELSLDWALGDAWRLRTSWSLARERLSGPVNGVDNAASGPEHQFALHGDWLVSPQINLSGALRYVDRIPLQRLDSFVQADLQLNWSPSQDWQLSLAGRNLLDHDGPEYYSELNDLVPADLDRAAFLQVRRSF